MWFFKRRTCSLRQNNDDFVATNGAKAVNIALTTIYKTQNFTQVNNNVLSNLRKYIKKCIYHIGFLNFINT